MLIDVGYRDPDPAPRGATHLERARAELDEFPYPSLARRSTFRDYEEAPTPEDLHDER